MRMVTILLFVLLLAGCAVHPKEPAQLYVHFGFDANDGPNWLLTAPVRAGEPFFVTGDYHAMLSGRVDRSADGWRMDVNGGDGRQSGRYAGPVVLEHPVSSQSWSFSGGVMGDWYALSTNANYRPAMLRINEVHDRQRGIIR